MQPISDEFLELIAQRLKVGELGKPICRVEIDRMAFIPGRVESLDFLTVNKPSEIEVERKYLPDPGMPNASPSDYDGEAVNTPINMVFPVDGANSYAGRPFNIQDVTSEYGIRGNSFHKGIDIDCHVGTPIVSPWDGVVCKVNTNRSISQGISVNVRHEGGLLTKYFHLDSVSVRVGQAVSAGDELGKGGNTGNCYSGNSKIVDTPLKDDPYILRPTEAGSHLHFEIWENVPEYSVTGNDAKGATHVNPRDYLEGSKKLYLPSTLTGADVVDEGNMKGFEGQPKFFEQFSKREWYKKNEYTVRDNFTDFAFQDKSNGNFYSRFIFPLDLTAPVSTGFDIKLNMKTEGHLNFNYRSNFYVDDGDYAVIKVDGKVVQPIKPKVGGMKLVQAKRIYIPAGEVTITFEIICGDKPAIEIGDDGVAYEKNKEFRIADLKIFELSPIATPQDKTVEQLDPTKGVGFDNPYKRDVTDLIFSEKEEYADIQVGDFVYMDTLTLDNVMELNYGTSAEQDCSEVTLTISNPNSFYNPDYNPFFFPTLHRRSPWSYWVNGHQLGAISENTPIRVYLGFGSNTIRVFTGLIDKVDIMGNESTLSITARDMYKKIFNKVLLEDKKYPDSYYDAVPSSEGNDDIIDSETNKTLWLKSAIVHDLVDYAGMLGWRANQDDLYYPDVVIEESYLTEANPREGTIRKAVKGKEGEFEDVPIDSIPTPDGWLNPFVESKPLEFPKHRRKVGECIDDVIKDTNYWAHCDRYGTFRLEHINLKKPIIGIFNANENIITISKSIDFSRSRSHIVVYDDGGGYAQFVDKEILLELKGELRTGTIEVPWARTYEAKKEVATRMFTDMKRISRSLSVSIPGNPSLDVYDRVTVLDKNTSTNSVYTIKGIRHTFSVDSGFVTLLELTWSQDGTVV